MPFVRHDGIILKNSSTTILKKNLCKKMTLQLHLLSFGKIKAKGSCDTLN